MNFVDIILFHGRANPELIAVGIPDSAVTFRQFGQGVLSAQRKLIELGAKPADLVGIDVDNPIRHLIVICALYQLGIASVSLRGNADGPLDRLGITLVLRDRPGPPPVQTRTEYVGDDWLSGPPPSGGGGKGFANPAAPCRIILSSGTTGQPKAMVFSAADIETRMVAYALRIATPAWERMLCMPGLSTNFGFGFSLAALWLGRRVSFTPAADAALRMIARYGLEFILASPQQMQSLVEMQTQRPMPLSSLKVIHVGGSILTHTFLNQVRARICNHVFVGYGATEVGSIAFAPAELMRGMDGAVGYVAPWATVEIQDEQGNPCGRGQEGNLRIRAEGQGRSFAIPGSSAPTTTIRDGWFYPGDRAVMTEDGILVITGRIGQMINAGGVKLAPEMIEEALQQHPDIADAGALGVIGGSGIEEIWVAVVARRDIAVEAVAEYLRQRHPNWGPRVVKFVSSIPRNELGKVAREELRKAVAG